MSIIVLVCSSQWQVCNEDGLGTGSLLQALT